MSEPLDDRSPDSAETGLSSLFRRMSQEFREEVVKRALDWREQSSGEARAAIRRAVDDCVEVAGFRYAGLAPPFRLREPVAEVMQRQDNLAGAVLRVWVESQEPLRSGVHAHLVGHGMTATGCDYSEGTIALAVNDGSQEDARASFLEGNTEANEDEVALMVCCVTGAVIAEADEFEADEEINLETLLADTFNRLVTTPSYGPEWEQVIPDFIKSVSSLIEAKEQERSRAATLDQLLTDIRAEFPQLIAFFQWHPRAWASANVHPHLGLEIAHDAASDIQGLLAEYAPIHDRAPFVAEELVRSVRRAELLPRILDAGNALNAMMDVGDESDEDEEPEPFQLPEDGDGVTVERRPQDDIYRRPESLPAEYSPLATGEHHVPAGEEFSEVPPCEIEDYLLLRLERQDLEQENDDLEQEVRILKEQLFDSRSKEEGFRLALSSQDGYTGENAPAIEDVSGAVGLAMERFSDRLLFQLNSNSSVEGNPFKWPDKVWNALEWLATIYYEARTGSSKNTDLNGSCRQASEMWYKTSQHDTTMATYRNSYTTRVNGRIIWLEEHIGKGTSFDPRRTIRIAFDWDRDLRKVVIGYIGRHQKTSAT